MEVLDHLYHASFHIGTYIVIFLERHLNWKMLCKVFVLQDYFSYFQTIPQRVKWRLMRQLAEDIVFRQWGRKSDSGPHLQ